MKQQVSPAIAAVVIVIVVGLAVFLIMRGTQGGGNKAPGEVGNPSPFNPGGAAVGKAPQPPQAAGNKNPMHP